MSVCYKAKDSTLSKFNLQKSTLNVHSIDSFGVHDGPGIRLVIFLQGCNIRCKYCQNPDTISLERNKQIPIGDLVKRSVNMKSYFGTHGGVTVSGGEPMLQSKMLIPFFKELKKEGIHTNIDTNGTITSKDAIQLIENVSDLIMFDIKHSNEEGFKNITGKNGLKNVLSNIRRRETSKKPFWLRYVLVLGYTDSNASLNWFKETFYNFKYLEKVEILPYHKLGQHKWDLMGWNYELKDVKENTEENLKRIEKKLQGSFNDLLIKR